MRSLALAAAAVALSLGACAGAPTAPSARDVAWTYTITPPAEGAALLAVEADVGDAAFIVAHEETREAIRSFELRVPSGFEAAPRTATGFALRACATPCRIRYTIDLAALVEACGRHLDCGMRFEGGVLAPASRWIARPGGDLDARIELRVRGGGPVALGLRKAKGDAYTFRASELEESSYTAFGRMRRRAAPPVDIALLGKTLAMTDDQATAWIGNGRSAIADFFGRFPAPTTVFVVPVGGDGVRFGSVSARTGASIALFVGDAMPATLEAEQHDWVLVHEMFHLGTPTFVGEGRWLEEGLATYYEPIIRARAGWISARELWTHFADQMRRGVREQGSPPSIEDRDEIDSIYWGGALFALLADVKIREATRGERSFDDAIRAVLANGGDVTHVWRVHDFFAFGDAVTGTRVLRDLHAAFLRGDTIDLAQTLDALGIVWSEGKDAELRDDRPLSAIRAAIAKRR